MAISNPAKIPEAKISSLSINSFDGGLDQRGKANIKSNSFSVGRNVMVNAQGLATHRLGLKRWLPDTVGTAGPVFPALVDNVVKYITADDGKIKYCELGDTSWTDCGGDNTVTTDGVINTFLRTQNKVVIMNGVDEFGYVDLSNMEVVHFDEVADPTVAPTGSNTGLSGTAHKVYYAIAYNGVVGTTKSTPILSQTVGKIRDQWKDDGTEGVTITDPNVRPPDAKSWNLYYAPAPVGGGTIALKDLVPIAMGIDINATTYFDNGQVDPLQDAGTAPETNTTKGPKAKYGIEIEGRPFFYGVTDDPYAVYIGGVGEDSLNFGVDRGGFRLVLNEGTNYFPMSIVGFRNGPGLPSITVMFSNTEGLSKQSIIEPNTISFGTYSAVVWGQTEQNYGAAGVSSPYAVVNYKGAMVFPTTDGILKLDTQASKMNVLLPDRISDPVIDEVGSIKTELLPQIVGTAWANRIMFSAPTRGFNYNNAIIVYDTTRKDNECWYVFDIRSQWIGTVSPPGSTGFVYIAQDNHFFRLDTMYVAQDETAEGLTQAFPVQLTTALIGSNTAHDSYHAVVQVTFYLLSFIGSVDLIVTWRDRRSGLMKTKTKTITNGEYAKSSVGNWSSPGYQFNQHLPTTVVAWGDTDALTDSQSVQKVDRRYKIRLRNVVTNELQATVAVNLDNSAFIARSVSFQGQNLGISPDVG